MSDWYRRTAWTKKDEDEFFLKLARARKDGRAQYLRIQAISLINTKNNEYLDIAENLLNQILTDYPDNKFEKSSTLNALGNIYKLKQDYEKAISYYEQSLDFEKIYPRVTTDSYLHFSELVIKINKKDIFGVAENLLESKIHSEIFPVNKYKIYSILAAISKEKKQLEKATHYATLAEQNANATTSGLRYHQYLGIVNERDTWLDSLVNS